MTFLKKSVHRSIDKRKINGLMIELNFETNKDNILEIDGHGWFKLIQVVRVNDFLVNCIKQEVYLAIAVAL